MIFQQLIYGYINCYIWILTKIYGFVLFVIQGFYSSLARHHTIDKSHETSDANT